MERMKDNKREIDKKRVYEKERESMECLGLDWLVFNPPRI